MDGVARNTVKKALASDQPPHYRRAAKGSIEDVVEPRIRALLTEFPDMPSTVIMERVGGRGRDRVVRPRPTVAAVVPATGSGPAQRLSAR